MGVDSRRVGTAGGRHDAEVVQRDMQLGPSVQSQVVLGGLHQARPPAIRTDAPWLRRKERLVERAVVRPDLHFVTSRVPDSVEVFAELACDGPRRRGSQDVCEAEAIDRKGLGSSTRAQVGRARIAERSPSNHPAAGIPPSITDLDNPVRSWGTGVVSQPRGFRVDDDHLSFGLGISVRASPRGSGHVPRSR
jgi:hypothetical protein